MSYTAVVLTDESRDYLLKEMANHIPAGWEVVAHHMTINMGKSSEGPAEHLLWQKAKLNVVSLGEDQRVVAVGVSTQVPSTNPIKHITLAVNRSAGAKPFHSNQLTHWTPITNFELEGIISELP